MWLLFCVSRSYLLLLPLLMYTIITWKRRRWLKFLNPWLWPWLCVVTPVHFFGMVVAMYDVIPVGVWLNLWYRCPNIWLFKCLLFIFWCLASQWGAREYSFPLFWWSVDDLLCLVLVGVEDRLSTLVFFFLVFSLVRDSILILLILGVAMVISAFVYIVLGLFSACMLSVGTPAIFPRYNCYFLDCLGHWYLELLVFSVFIPCRYAYGFSIPCAYFWYKCGFQE